jgi:hypothetical protein
MQRRQLLVARHHVALEPADLVLQDGHVALAVHCGRLALSLQRGAALELDLHLSRIGCWRLLLTTQRLLDGWCILALWRRRRGCMHGTAEVAVMKVVMRRLR